MVVFKSVLLHFCSETRNLKLEVENEAKSLELEKKTIDRKLRQDPEFTRYVVLYKRVTWDYDDQ